ncbi:hypothetical protein ACYT6T_09970, partial [Streptococcus pyogenes]
EERELAELPEKIAALEAKQTQLAEQLADPSLYADGNTKAEAIHAELAILDEQLLELFERWEKLEQ